MKNFKIVPLSVEYAAKIRETKKDEFGHDVVEQLATSKRPCRISLKPFKASEDRRLLILHSPFAIDNAYNQPGPVFISAKDVEPYKDLYQFPPDIPACQKFKSLLFYL